MSHKYKSILNYKIIDTNTLWDLLNFIAYIQSNSLLNNLYYN